MSESNTPAPKGLSKQAQSFITVGAMLSCVVGLVLLVLNLVKLMTTDWWISVIFLIGLPLVLFIVMKAGTRKPKKRRR